MSVLLEVIPWLVYCFLLYQGICFQCLYFIYAHLPIFYPDGKPVYPDNFVNFVNGQMHSRCRQPINVEYLQDLALMFFLQARLSL